MSRTTVLDRARTAAAKAARGCSMLAIANYAAGRTMLSVSDDRRAFAHLASSAAWCFATAASAAVAHVIGTTERDHPAEWTALDAPSSEGQS